MGKRIEYRNKVLDVLQKYKAKFKESSKNIRGIILDDSEQSHIQFLWMGWDGDHHVFSVVTHIEITDDKIWIQYDSTEVGIANLLVENDIPKEEIVLGYFSPHHRRFTDFAAA